MGNHGMNDGFLAWNDNRYKLLKHMPDKLQLFDLQQDPWEKTDVAAIHPEIVKRMNAELEAWRASVFRSNDGADYPGGLRKSLEKESP
jgi:arylsulfatase A-like enzyme